MEKDQQKSAQHCTHRPQPRSESAHTPNARTIAAMEEVLSGGGIQHASIDAMFEDCGIDIKKIRAAKKR